MHGLGTCRCGGQLTAGPADAQQVLPDGRPFVYEQVRCRSCGGDMMLADTLSRFTTLIAAAETAGDARSSRDVVGSVERDPGERVDDDRRG
jgi:hypothetical protein